MKSRLLSFLLIILLGLFWPGKMAGQSSTPKGYTLRYEYMNLGMHEKHEVILAVRGSESLTVIKSGVPLDTKTVEKDFSVHGDDAIGIQVYKNAKTGETIFRDFYALGGAMEPCVVKDPVSKLTWKFLPETKKIGTYTCKSARTQFRGRTYLAWYTEDIPVSHGPWKLGGLPGAAVEVESTDHLILFRLVKVESNTTLAIQKPADGVSLSMEEYVKRKESSTEDLINAIKAKLPRGAEVTVNTTADYNLETDFSDIKK
jgi:GLPGLI family protein